jgi:hypothetical protein
MIQNTYFVDYIKSQTNRWHSEHETKDIYEAIESAVNLSKKDNILKARVYDFTNERTVLLIDKSYM